MLSRAGCLSSRLNSLILRQLSSTTPPGLSSSQPSQKESTAATAAAVEPNEKSRTEEKRPKGNKPNENREEKRPFINKSKPFGTINLKNQKTLFNLTLFPPSQK